MSDHEEEKHEEAEGHDDNGEDGQGDRAGLPTERRRRGRPAKPKGPCAIVNCEEPELCNKLCRRCYHLEYTIKKKQMMADRPPVPPGERPPKKTSSKRSNRGPFTTPDGEVIDTPYIVELANNARTKCFASKKRIHADELRIGILRSKNAGDTSCRWYRPEHFPIPSDFSLRKLHGRKKLDHDDRVTLKRIFGHCDPEGHRRSKHSRHHSSSSKSRSRSSKHRSSSSSKRSRSSKHESSSSSKRHRSANPVPPLEYHQSGSEHSSYSDSSHSEPHPDEGSHSSYSSSRSGSGSESERDWQ